MSDRIFTNGEVRFVSSNQEKNEKDCEDMSPNELRVKLHQTKDKSILSHLFQFIEKGKPEEKKLATSTINQYFDLFPDLFQSRKDLLIKNLHKDEWRYFPLIQSTLICLMHFELDNDDIKKIKFVYRNHEHRFVKNNAKKLLDKYNQNGILKDAEESTSLNESISGNNQNKGGKSGYVYFLKEDFSDTYKIGMSKQIDERVKSFHVKLPFNVSLEHAIYCFDYVETEKALHTFFKEKRVNGEWFMLSTSDVLQIKTQQFPNSIMKHILGEHCLRLFDMNNDK